MENPKFKTPAWTLFDDVVLFHPDGEEIAKMVYNREMGFTAVTTYVRDILFPMQPLPICITGFLLQMFMFLKKDGLIVHGGVIQSNKSVLVVSGNSGAGKSTIANLIKSHLNFSATQIADDRFIMRKHGNDIYAFGNPFDTKLERNKNVYVPIGNFLFLRHGKSNTIRQLNSKDAAINFFKVFMLPYWDIDLLKWSVGYIETLLKFIPCFEYYFLPDESSVEFLIKKNLL
jgi:hypothetical protein